MEDTFSLTDQTRTKLALPLGRQAFVFMKNEILGEKYCLSIALVSEKKSQEINFQYRNKNNPTNVLSFCLSKTEGELILCPSLIKKESKDKEKNFGMDFGGLLRFLTIHGMLHLKGMDHGAKMETAEKKYLLSTKFLIK